MLKSRSVRVVRSIGEGRFFRLIIVMKFPACNNTDWMLTDRQGITIDYCPFCRGVSLDRGQLDKRSDQGATVTRLIGGGARSSSCAKISGA